MRVQIAGTSHMGRVRKNNEDSFFFDEGLGLAIVADGIGGRRGGEVASGMVVHGIRTALLSQQELRFGEMGNFLLAILDSINEQILHRGLGDSRFEGMGTTLECLAFTGNNLVLAHIGDSRTYLHQDRQLWQLTLDHNVETFVKRGLLGPQYAQAGMKRAALVKGVGLGEKCEADIYEMSLKPGQVFLACSDGLYDMVGDVEICNIITAHRDQIEELPKILVDAANAHGGNDNVTVVVCSVED